MPVGQVGFDDLCGLQDYFDILEMKRELPPQMVSSSQVEGEKTRGGRSRFAFETPFQLETVRRVLNENWRRLPEGLASATRLDLEVQWSDRAGLRRAVTTEDATLIVTEAPGTGDGKTPTQEIALPYHVCLSELLFGAPIYHQRRDVFGLAPLPLPSSMVVKDNGDGGVPGGGGVSGHVSRPDGGSSSGDAGRSH